MNIVVRKIASGNRWINQSQKNKRKFIGLVQFLGTFQVN